MLTGLYGVKIASQRFVDAVSDRRLRNFRFVPAREYADKIGS